MRGTLPHLAFRTLFFSKQRFLKLLNLVTISGIAFSIFALVLVTSILFGFREELNKRWISFHSHLAVTHLSDEKEMASLLEKLKTVKEIDEAVSFVEGEVIAEIKRWEE
ncbi:MAG: hypothetical protein Q7S68_02055, partial [Deltaproteobacteria bacterium]|nr:hypothetical protein [Deltaproteobacteria bacterium]